MLRSERECALGSVRAHSEAGRGDASRSPVSGSPFHKFRPGLTAQPHAQTPSRQPG